MARSQFSLSWGAHKANICTGLSSLQQNGEFVDMTLAADGHHVKVHQVIMALASPYIKELISSAQCSHPVIFLNKISYNTLSSILEYIYTGEVLVSVDNLSELVEAGKELHIKGLEDMKFNQSEPIQSKVYDNYEVSEKNEEAMEDDYCYFEVTSAKDDEKYVIYGPPNNTRTSDVQTESANESLDEQTFDDIQDDNDKAELPHEDISTEAAEVVLKPYRAKAGLSKNSGTDVSIMQYTVSNQGSLQMILNRYMYYLKHTKRDGTRQWRCVDYLSNSRCPALVVTSDDIVTQRLSAHMHSFHDKRILKKVQAGAIYTAIQEAVEEGNNKKQNKPDSEVKNDSE